MPIDVDVLIAKLTSAPEGDRILDRQIALAVGLDFEPVFHGTNWLPGRKIKLEGQSFIEGGLRWWWFYAEHEGRDPFEFTAQWDMCDELPRYTTSIDAALSLVRTSVGWNVGGSHDLFTARVAGREVKARTAYLALCAAALADRCGSR